MTELEGEGDSVAERREREILWIPWEGARVGNVEGRGAIGEGKLAHYSLHGCLWGGTPGVGDLLSFYIV